MIEIRALLNTYQTLSSLPSCRMGLKKFDYNFCTYFTKEHMKDIIQYLSVVLICFQGPTEAERKIEELTRQLEEEMEKQEEEGEYFGKLLSLNFLFSKS
jgi:hypothetical protein